MPEILKTLLRKVLRNETTTAEHAGLLSLVANFPILRAMVAGLGPIRPMFQGCLWRLSIKPDGDGKTLLGELARSCESISVNIFPNLPEDAERDQVTGSLRRIVRATGAEVDVLIDLLQEIPVKEPNQRIVAALGQIDSSATPILGSMLLPMHGCTRFQFHGQVPVGKPIELIICRFSSSLPWLTEILEFELTEGKLSPVARAGQAASQFSWDVGTLAAAPDEEAKLTRKKRISKPAKKQGLNGYELFASVEMLELSDKRRNIAIHFHGNDFPKFVEQRQPLIVECEQLDDQGRSLPLALNANGAVLTRLVSFVDWDCDPAVIFPMVRFEDGKLQSHAEEAAQVKLTLRLATDADLTEMGSRAPDQVLLHAPQIESHPVDDCADGNWICEYPLGELFSETEEPTMRMMRVVPKLDEEVDGKTQANLNRPLSGTEPKDEVLNKLIDTAMRIKTLLPDICRKHGLMLEGETYFDQDDLLQDVAKKLAVELRLGKEVDLIIKLQQVLRTCENPSQKLQALRDVLTATVEQQPYLQNLCEPLLSAIFKRVGHTKAFKNLCSRIERAYMIRVELHMLAEDETSNARRTRGWLYKTVLNHRIELYRTQKNRTLAQSKEDKVGEPCLFDPASHKLGSDELAYFRELERALRAEVDACKYSVREVFNLRADRYTFREIAEKLKMPQKTVESIFDRLMKSLIERLGLAVKKVSKRQDLDNSTV